MSDVWNELWLVYRHKKDGCSLCTEIKLLESQLIESTQQVSELQNQRFHLTELAKWRNPKQLAKFWTDYNEWKRNQVAKP